MTTYSSFPDGNVDPEELNFLRRRAEGGFGLVMTAACCVHPSGWAFPGQWQCSDDRFLPSLRSMAEAIHAGGAPAILQIHHGGRECPPTLAGGECISASAVASPRPNSAIPRAMTESEIVEVIDAFGAATRRAAEAGYDGVEIHGANTYLLQQFVSPDSNRRNDVWGQDRLRFSLEIVDRVLRNAPTGFVVGYRFSTEEPQDPGLRVSDTERLIEALCRTSLDFLHVSLRDYRQESMHASFKGTMLEHIVQQVAKRKPLIGVGSIRSLSDAKNAIEMGCDLVALARVAISDPEWPRHPESPRTKIPRGDFATELTVPAGLAKRIESAEGWFEREPS